MYSRQIDTNSPSKSCFLVLMVRSFGITNRRSLSKRVFSFCVLFIYNVLLAVHWDLSYISVSLSFLLMSSAIHLKSYQRLLKASLSFRRIPCLASDSRVLWTFFGSLGSGAFWKSYLPRKRSAGPGPGLGLGLELGLGSARR